jgi:WD40 repeat protein
MKGHTDAVNAVAFSPDGQRIVSGGADNTVRLWDTDTGKPVGGPMLGHTDAVKTAAFSPDGHRIVSGSYDTSLRLWDADTGKPVGGPMFGHQGDVFGVAFSSDGNRIVSASQDETLRLWPAPAPSAWPGLLCDKLTQNMSHQQWRDLVSPDIDYITVCPGLPMAADAAD